MVHRYKLLQEPLSGVALLAQELRHQELLEGVASFSSSALRHTTTLERTVLPDTEALQQEKSHTEFIQVCIVKVFRSRNEMRLRGNRLKNLMFNIAITRCGSKYYVQHRYR
jgi:precorrin-2 methylase